MDHRHQTLIITPTGMSWLFDNRTGHVWTGLDTNVSKEMLHQFYSLEDNPNRFMNIEAHAGIVHLFYYRRLGRREALLTLEPSILREMLQDESTDVRLQRYDEQTFQINPLTGAAHAQPTIENTLNVTKINYGLAGLGWFVKFSLYKAHFVIPEGEEQLFNVPCNVYHTIEQTQFLRECRNPLRIQAFNGQTIQDMEWKHTRSRDLIVISGPLINETERSQVWRGTFDSVLPVAVKVTPRDNQYATDSRYAKVYQNLWNTHTSRNVVRFYGAEFTDNECLYAFERFECVLDSNMQLFETMRKSWDWMPFVRGVTQGLVDMHERGVAHNNLNTSNIVLNNNNLDEPMICGMGRSTELTEAGREFDIECYVRTILACFTSGTLHEYQFNDNLMDLINSCEPQVMALGLEFQEVQTLLSLLRLPRRRLDHILHFYWLLDVNARIRWMIHLNNALQKLSQNDRSLINGLAQFSHHHWIHEIAKHPEVDFNQACNLVVYTESFRVNQRRYNQGTVCELVHFMRNVLTHRADTRACSYGAPLLHAVFGDTDLTLEERFSEMFLGLMNRIFNFFYDNDVALNAITSTEEFGTFFVNIHHV